jgi:hypothetical protein
MNTATMRQMMHTRWNIRAAVAAVLLSAGAAAPALAQLPLANPIEKPAEVTREAYAAPYGRAMVAEFNTVLRAAVDPACLQSKKLKPEQLAQRGEALITKWSIHAMEVFASFINISIYETNLAKNAGVTAQAELTRLRANPDVKRYLAIERPRQLAKLLDYVFEQFSRYVLINRIKFGQVSPLATANETLMRADPTDKVEAELEQFLKANTSAQLTRYLELNEQAAAALAASLNTEQVRNNFSPTALFRGMEKDLAALCVTSTNNPR